VVSDMVEEGPNKEFEEEWPRDRLIRVFLLYKWPSATLYNFFCVVV
jgi:hypothetical protein